MIQTLCAGRVRALILAFKDLGGHPRCASLVVGHVSLDIARCSKVANLQHSPACHEEKTTKTGFKSHYGIATH